MPRLAAGDEVEAPAGVVPVLEGRLLDGHAVAPREGGHPRVGLDAQDPAAARLQGAGGDPGAAADVEHVARPVGHERVDERRRVAGPRPVVALGLLPEGLRATPVGVQRAHQRTSWRSMTPAPWASGTPPGSVPANAPNGWR